MGTKATTGPNGADSENPHRAARAATRSLLAQNAISTSSDIPQVSMGYDGTWVRCLRKPSVSKAGKMTLESTDQAMEAMEALQTGVYVSEVDENIRNGCEIDTSRSFDVNLNDCKAFPALPLMQVEARAEKEMLREVPKADVTPEKSAQLNADCESAEKEIEQQLGQDWVVLSDDVSKVSGSAHVVEKNAFDGRHPRNIFAKKAASKPMTSKVAGQEADAPGLDWSQAGVPVDLVRRLIRGSVNAAHRSPSEKKVAPLPVHVMRAQNIGSSNKRERSTPKSPRCQSKPCMIKPPTNRR
jgi:hypothetical protein